MNTNQIHLQEPVIPSTREECYRHFRDSWIWCVMHSLSLDESEKPHIEKIFDESFIDRYVVIFNNVSNTKKIIRLTEFFYKIPNVAILNENGVLNIHPAIQRSVPAQIVDGGIENRQTAKRAMRHAEHVGDDILAETLDRLQNIFKKLINADYGLGGYPGSLFYNKYVADVITTAGRNITACASMTIETLGGFRNYMLDAHLRLIDYTIEFDCDMLNNKYKLSNRKVDEVLRHLLGNHYDNYYAKTALTNKLQKLTQSQLNCLYMRNNIFEFIRNPVIKPHFQNILKNITKELPLLHYDKDKIKVDNGEVIFPYKEDMHIVINAARELISGFVHFSGDYQDGVYCPTLVEQIAQKRRTTVLGMDTDSTNSTFYRFYKSFVSAYKQELEDNPVVLKESIVLIMAHIVVAIIKDSLWRYTAGIGVPEELRPKIDLEIEHIMKQILLNPLAKKQYSFQALVTDFFLLQKKKVKVTGYVFTKGTTNPIVQERIKDLLVNDVMVDIDKIDYHGILCKIKDETDNQKRILVDPKYLYDHKTILKVKKEDVALSDYRMKAVLLWNLTYGERYEMISLPGSMGVVSLQLTQELLDLMKRKFPEDYAGFKKYAIILRKYKLCSRVIRKGASLKQMDLTEFERSLYKFKLSSKEVNRFISFLTKINDNKDYNIINYNESFYKDIISYYEGIMIAQDKKIINNILDVEMPFNNESYIDKIILEFIDRLALPQNTAKVPDLLEYNNNQIIDKTQASEYEHLLSPIPLGLGFICPRNDNGDAVVSSVLSTY